MFKPPALQQLIDELQADVQESSVMTTKDSTARVYIDEDAADAEDAIILNRRDCEILLQSAKSVQSLHEALGEPEDASIELHDLDLSSEVIDALEMNFIAVDEA